MKFIIEGLDHLGKSTLVAGIKNRLGFHQVIHYGKPEVLNYYTLKGMGPKYEYQKASFINLFNILNSNVNAIFDRAHIGEAVYAQLYRGYSGEYVWALEESFGADYIDDLRLILLTENFKVSTHFKDDGESFDISKREAEQDMFIDAFNKSIIKDKIMICVTDHLTGQFLSKEQILEQALAGIDQSDFDRIDYVRITD
jgi:thymidylate kinase